MPSFKQHASINHGWNPRAVRSVRRPAVAVGAQAVGVLALAAVGVGALAVGALAIGQLAIGRARIRRLEIDELVVRRLHADQPLHTPEPRDTDR